MSAGLIVTLQFFMPGPPSHPQCHLRPPSESFFFFNASLGSRPPLLGQAYTHPVALFIFRVPEVLSLCAGRHAVWPGWQVICYVSGLSPHPRETPSSAGLCCVASVSLWCLYKVESHFCRHIYRACTHTHHFD